MESSGIELHGGHVVAMTAILTTTLTFLVVVLAGILVPMWRKVRLTEMETKLKSDLLAAGYCADDIVRVVRASSAHPVPGAMPPVVERHTGRGPAVPDAIRARF